MIIYISGDIAKTKAMWIVQQCNITSTKSKGLSAYIFRLFPYADTYKQSTYKREVGTVSWHGYDVPYQKQGIVNMYAQKYPGKAKMKGQDTKEQRLQWFKNCLECLKEMNHYDPIEYGSFAFPDHIGCGLAGGNWEKDYFPLIAQFANTLHSLSLIYIHKKEC